MKIDRNDLLHIESCALLVLVLLLFLPWWAACSVTLAVGIIKECWDAGHCGVASWSDIVFDIAGIMAGMGIYMIGIA